MNPFGLPAHQLAAFARPVLQYLPAGYEADDAAQAEIDDVGSLAALASPDVVAARIGRLGVSVSAWDMTERLLEASDDRTVVSGLRYLNLDPAFPFVAVKTTARVNDAEAVDALAAQVAEAYRGVRVRGFTFWEQPGLKLSSAENWATVMAGSVDMAARADGRDLTGTLTISWPVAATDVFADYQREHQAWRADAPELSSFVSESGQEGLQEAADQGLLMSLRDDLGFAGLAAATMSPLFGRRAVCMLDVFLTERLRGRGLAPAMQSVFLAGQRSGADTVWGHIHAENLPSLRTAQKLGRRPVQQEYFVSLSAY
ncbi:hypothetical protein SAMN04487916_12046 [Arthrobacter sp. ov407]|uniref:GNAT family N-acetyltransferase n=1 Tax=Arthrobacter sp. ov407 TaxID=1761748 RepID=UPI000885885A|nr:GNAT family N-acetyltransferase [Arthrobacter sp. ov407]SDL98964.1 hypothetical protein SAMN04487916_12046 [Arthrobacter sp. ov407]